MKARIYNFEWLGNHPQNWLDANQSKIIGGQLVSQWILTEILPTENELNYQKLMFDGVNYYEGATPEEINIKNNQLRNEEIKSKYELHKANGWKAYQDFRAKIVSDIYDGIITEEQAFAVEANLKIAYDRIAQNGDWKTARFELQQVNPFPEFVQYYYDLALNYINQYIIENYEN